MKLVRLMVVATLWVPAAALAQQPDSKKQPAEEHAPAPVPPELAELDWMVGEWKADMRWEASSMGPAGQSTGTETVEEGPGGQSHLSDFKGEIEGQPFEGHGVTTYDPQTKRYVTVWTDSMMPGVMVLEGRKRGEDIVLEGRSTGPDGKPMKHRSTLSDLSEDSYRMTMERQEKGKWVKAFTIDYTRQ